MNGANLSMPVYNGEKYIHYEVSSGGHFCDLGLDLFASSNKMEEVIKFSTIIPSLQFVYSPSSDNFYSQYFDYSDAYLEMEMPHLNIFLDEDFKNDFIQTLEYLKEGDFLKAIETNFSQMSLEDKIEKNLVLDSYHTSISAQSINGNNKLLDTKKSLAKMLPVIDGEYLDIDNDLNSYTWINNQLHVGWDYYDEETSKNSYYIVPYIVPFILLAEEYELENEDVKLYMANMTKEDKASFDIVVEKLKQLGIDNPYTK